MTTGLFTFILFAQLMIAGPLARAESSSFGPSASQAADCSRYINMIFTGTEKLAGLEYKKLSDSQIAEGAENLHKDLQRAFEADVFANKTYTTADVLLAYLQPAHNLSRGLTKRQEDLAGGQMAKTLEEVRLLLHGAGSLDAKIKELQAAINKTGILVTEARKKKLIVKAASEAGALRFSIYKNAYSLASVLEMLGGEYKLQNIALHFMDDQLKILELLRARLIDTSAESDIAEVIAAVSKKIDELHFTRNAMEMMLSESNKLIIVINQVMTDAEQINGASLRTAIVDASKVGVDLSPVLGATLELPKEQAAKAALRAKRRARFDQELNLIATMTNKHELLKKLVDFLGAVQNRDLDLAQFERIVALVPRNEVHGVENYRGLVEAMKNHAIAYGSKQWKPAFTTYDLIIFHEAIRRLSPVSSENAARLQKTLDEIQSYTRTLLTERKKNEAYVIDLLRLYAVEAELAALQ
jgi:hypothetical protein